MKVLLVNPLVQPILWEDDLVANWPPLGLSYLAAVLEAEKHEVKILERRRIAAKNGLIRYTPENVNRIDKLTRGEIETFQPDIVGFTADTPLIMDAYRTARLLKSIRDVPTVFGGFHPTFDPIRTLSDCKAVDIIVAGEGENSMSEIAAGVPLQAINGISYRVNGVPKSNTLRKPMADLDHLPFPARHLLDEDFYFRAPSANLIRGFWAKGTTIFTARGCPFECTFCQSPQFTRLGNGKTFRAFSPEYVIREIQFLVDRYGMEAILFSEDIFNINRRRAVEICEQLIATGLNKRIIWAADLRVDLVDPEMLHTMARAGCVRVIYGTESGSDRTLKNIKKKATVAEAYKAIRWVQVAGMTCEANIVIGFPDETRQDFLDTINFLKRARPDRVNRGKLFPLPGTEIYYDLKAKGIVKDTNNWNDMMEYYTRSDFTFSAMTAEEFNRLKAKFDREVTLPINYWFNIKTNWRRNRRFALQQFLMMIAHISVLYLPIPVQKALRRLADRYQLKSRVVFRSAEYND